MNTSIGELLAAKDLGTYFNLYARGTHPNAKYYRSPPFKEVIKDEIKEEISPLPEFVQERLR